MWEVAEPILQMAFPDGPEAGAPSGLLEHLELVPERLRVKLKRTVLTTTVQALAIVKSHYPGVDLRCFEEGDEMLAQLVVIRVFHYRLAIPRPGKFHFQNVADLSRGTIGHHYNPVG